MWALSCQGCQHSVVVLFLLSDWNKLPDDRVNMSCVNIPTLQSFGGSFNYNHVYIALICRV